MSFYRRGGSNEDGRRNALQDILEAKYQEEDSWIREPKKRLKD